MPNFYESDPIIGETPTSGDWWKADPKIEDEGFETPITPEEERKLPLPIPKPTLREDIRDTIQENLRDLPGLPTRLLTAAGKATGLVSPDAPELPTIPQAIGGTLAMGGEAAAGAVSRMVRGDPWHTVISQFGRGPEQLATGEKESLARVIPIEMARMAPAIAAIPALTMAGVSPPIAGGVPFGLQTLGQTGDPVAAMQSGAIGALIPGVGSAGRAGGELMAQRAAAKLGAGEIATRGLEATGRLVGSQSLVGGLLTASAAPELIELAKNDPEGFQHEMVKIIAMNLAFEVPHLGANVRQVMARERVDQYMRDPAYKRDIDNALISEQTARRQQGITEIPPAELARLKQESQTFDVIQKGIKEGLSGASREVAKVAGEPVPTETAVRAPIDLRPPEPTVEPVNQTKVEPTSLPPAEPVVAVPKVEPAAPVAELEATPKAVEPAREVSLEPAKAEGQASSLEQTALEFASKPDNLRKRLQSALDFERVKDRVKWKLDFENRQLVSPDGKKAVRWKTRKHPDRPDSYENQQTNQGSYEFVDLTEATPKGVSEPAPTINPAPISSSLIEAKAEPIVSEPNQRAYDEAKAQYSKEYKAFTEAQKKYRAREIGDAEFLSARERINKAQETFDQAETQLIDETNRAYEASKVAKPTPAVANDLFPDLKGKAPTLDRVRSAIGESEMDLNRKIEAASGEDVRSDSPLHSEADAAQRRVDRLRTLAAKLEQKKISALKSEPALPESSKAEPVSTPTEAVSKVKQEVKEVAKTSATPEQIEQLRRIADVRKNWKGKSPYSKTGKIYPDIEDTGVSKKEFAKLVKQGWAESRGFGADVTIKGRVLFDREFTESLYAIGRKPPTPTPEFSPDALQSEGGQNLGITPAGVSVPAGTIDTLLKKTRQAFTVSGKLPREAHELQTAMEGQRRASEFDIRMTQRDFMRAISEVYGIGPTARLGGGTKRIPPADVQLMDEYLHGRTTPEQSARIPTQIRGQLDNMRNQIEGWSQRTIDTLTDQMNRLDPDNTKAKNLLARIETIQENMDVYVHRSYKFFDSKKDADTWYGNLPLGDRIKAEQYLSTAKEITPEQARSELLRWLNDLKDESSGGTGGKLGSKDLTMFMQRKKIPAELRAVLGEYRNPVVNYAKSVSNMADFVAKQRFLDEVRKKGMGEWLFEEGSDPPGFNTKLAGEGSESMSPLSGLRTSKDIADAFNGMDAPSTKNAFVRSYLTLNAWTKFANTGLSLMTQTRNLLSRPLMAGMAGHWKVGNAPRAIRAIYEDFAGSNQTWRTYLNRLHKLGVVGDTTRASELRELWKDASLQDVNPAELTSWSLGRALKKSFVKIPGDIYRLSDELGNIYGFENERATQKKINPTWTDAQLDAEAARITRNIYPTYSETPKIVQSFRKNILFGPFVTFPYQVYRTMWNSIGQSMHEIASQNPVERTVGAKRLASQVATLAAPFAAQEIGKLLLGVSSQEEDDFRRFQPTWSKNSKWLFTGKDSKTGELSAVNLSYLDPYSYGTDIINAVVGAIRTKQSPMDAFERITKETFRPWVSEQMLVKAFIEARNGTTDAGREIFNPTDSASTKFTKQVGHVVTALEPGTIQRAQKRIIPAFKDEQPRFGRKLEPVREITREITGVAVEKFNFKTALGNKARPFITDTDSAEDVFRRAATQTQKTSNDQIVEAYRESEKRRRAIWDDMRNNYLAAMRRGVPKLEAYSIMKARGLSKRDADSIESGVYKPQPITPYVQDRATQIGRTLPMDALNAERSRLSPQLTPEDRKRLFGK